MPSAARTAPASPRSLLPSRLLLRATNRQSSGSARGPGRRVKHGGKELLPNVEALDTSNRTFAARCSFRESFSPPSSPPPPAGFSFALPWNAFFLTAFTFTSRDPIPVPPRSRSRCSWPMPECSAAESSREAHSPTRVEVPGAIAPRLQPYRCCASQGAARADVKLRTRLASETSSTRRGATAAHTTSILILGTNDPQTRFQEKKYLTIRERSGTRRVSDPKGQNAVETLQRYHTGSAWAGSGDSTERKRFRAGSLLAQYSELSFLHSTKISHSSLDDDRRWRHHASAAPTPFFHPRACESSPSSSVRTAAGSIGLNCHERYRRTWSVHRVSRLARTAGASAPSRPRGAEQYAS